MVDAISQITAALERVYGVPRVARSNPLDELILTILSQNTNDTNSDRAMARLRQRFPTWEAVLRARKKAVADAIRVGGLGNIKADRIQKILKAIARKNGRLDLSFLKKLPVPEAKRYLRSFKGVGPKTAACVLLFSCQRPAFPVDTHIHRIGRRMGWLLGKVSDEQAHEIMESLVTQDKYLSLHINLIRHGRATCRPQQPKCHACCIADYCAYFKSQL
jgi:endonuclease-3